MPGGMPGNVEKGFIFRALEEFLSTSNKDQLESLKKALGEEPYQPIPEIAQDFLGATKVRNVDKTHLEKHWFNPRSRLVWWIDHQPIDPIVRHGLIQAIDLRLANMDLSVDIYWICAGHSMEMVSCVSDRQITLLVLTPSVPLPPRLGEPLDSGNYKYGDKPENIYVTRPPATGPGETNVLGKIITDDHVTVRPRRFEQN